METIVMTLSCKSLYLFIKPQLIIDCFYSSSNNNVNNVRMMTIAKSPISAVYSLPYVITAAGVELVTGKGTEEGTEDEPKEIIYMNEGNFWEGSIHSRPTTTPGAFTDAQHTVVTEQQMGDLM